MSFFIKNIYKIFVCVVIVAPLGLVHSQSRPSITLPDNPFDLLVPTDFCEVTRNPHRYDGKVIRLQAILAQHIESADLSPYDSKDCWYGMRARYDCDTDAACRKLSNRLRQSRKGQTIGRGAVVITGRFFHRKLLTAREARWGLSHYEFSIMTVEDILDMPKEKGEPLN